MKRLGFQLACARVSQVLYQRLGKDRIVHSILEKMRPRLLPVYLAQRFRGVVEWRAKWPAP